MTVAGTQRWMSVRGGRRLLARQMSHLGVVLALLGTHLPAPAQDAQPSTEPRTVLQTTVRRVVVDVTVTDAGGKPVTGLSKEDFQVSEDGKPQKILSFDANGVTPAMDYVPPSLPPQPANTFYNLPALPEKGPLYVLLYDLVDIDDPSQMDTPEDHHTQIYARQQMVKFIQNKPEGARFAIFVRSDGLHLVQGFTADKALLYATLDPRTPRPHLPRVFLMAPNYGRGNRLGALDTLHRIAVYLDGLPGRKNVIWFSSMFPLSLFPEQTDGPNFQRETKATLDLMAHNQIAVYPVDARGVALEDSHMQITTSTHSPSVGSDAQPTPAQQGGNGIITTSGGATGGGGNIQGDSLVNNSFNIMDAVARETGGRAFYGTNDIAAELSAATASGETYYTLTYAPTNREFNGDARAIHVDIDKKGYQLAYRRTYYGTELPGEVSVPPPSAAGGVLNPGKHAAAEAEPVMDTLSANMQHGAPAAHQLVFVVKAQPVGEPALGTPAEMAQLATEPAYFKLRRRADQGKPLAPVPLQKDSFAFAIPVRQFQHESGLDLELAIAAYNADGDLLNAVVRLAKKDITGEGAAPDQPRFYRIEQELEVPAAAASLRFAVRDVDNDRTGSMEITLPLAGQAPAVAASAGGH